MSEYEFLGMAPEYRALPTCPHCGRAEPEKHRCDRHPNGAMPSTTKRLRHAQRSKARRRREKVFFRDKYECRRCGAQSNLTIEHIIPLSQGGTSAMDNLQTLCFRCNMRKNVEDQGRTSR